MTQAELHNDPSKVKNDTTSTASRVLLDILRQQSAILRHKANDKKISIEEFLEFQAALAVQVDANKLTIKRIESEISETKNSSKNDTQLKGYHTTIGKIALILSGATSVALPIALIAPTSVTLPLLGALAGCASAIFAARSAKDLKEMERRLELLARVTRSHSEKSVAEAERHWKEIAKLEETLKQVEKANKSEEQQLQRPKTDI